MTHAFNVGMAADHGLPAAILYHEIDYWCRENSAKNQNIRDGCAWMYRSLPDFRETFPYLTEYAIRQGLKDLEDTGLIRSGNYNRLGLDRTKWYTTQVEMFTPSHDMLKSTDGVSKSTDGDIENDRWRPSNQQMDNQKSTDGVSKTTDASGENDRAIPSINTSITPSGKTTIKESGKETITTSSTGGAGETVSRPTTTTLSPAHVALIQRKTMNFNLKQLEELVSMGSSETNIALSLYDIRDDRPLPWASIYETWKGKLLHHKTKE